MSSIDVRVLGGLEITVEFSIGRSEPDVGIMGDYVDEWYITHISGRALRKNEKCQWLYDRIEKAKEEDTIIEKCLEYSADDYYEED